MRGTYLGERCRVHVCQQGFKFACTEAGSQDGACLSISFYLIVRCSVTEPEVHQLGKLAGECSRDLPVPAYPVLRLYMYSSTSIFM